jgi:hypothetical protein
VFNQSSRAYCCERQSECNLWERVIVLWPFYSLAVFLLEEDIVDDELDDIIPVDSRAARVKFLDIGC